MYTPFKSCNTHEVMALKFQFYHLLSPGSVDFLCIGIKYHNFLSQLTKELVDGSFMVVLITDEDQIHPNQGVMSEKKWHPGLVSVATHI